MKKIMVLLWLLEAVVTVGIVYWVVTIAWPAVRAFLIANGVKGL